MDEENSFREEAERQTPGYWRVVGALLKKVPLL